MRNFLEVTNLKSGYFNKPVLKDINFSIKKGEFVGIIGPNGAGKSTLIKTLSKTLTPFGGKVFYKGKDIYKMPLSEVAQSIAVVPQDTLIVFEFLVWDIVMMGRIPYIKKFQGETENDLKVIEKSLELTDTKELASRFMNELSAGERQRAIIAKALAQEPDLLILDEPTSHLDISHQIDIFDLIKSLSKKEGLTVMAVLHDLNLASEYCDRLILLKEGAVFKEGTPKEVLDYRIIEEVYKTVVVVRENPISGKPYVFLVPQEKRNERKSTR